MPSTTLSPSVRRGYALGLMSTLHRPLRGVRRSATHAVAALTPLPTALQLASKDDAAYSLDSPANVLTIASQVGSWHGKMVSDNGSGLWRLTPVLRRVSLWLSTVSEASETSRLAQQLCAVVRPSETRIAACSP